MTDYLLFFDEKNTSNDAKSNQKTSQIFNDTKKKVRNLFIKC